MFPRSSSLKHIYWDSKCNTKLGLYGTGALRPPHLFSTIDDEEHRTLRKALSNAPWTIGQLKSTWGLRFDDQVNLSVEKMHDMLPRSVLYILSDKVAEFAADIVSMISFTDPFGCIKGQRDEKEMLAN
jgi:hypothetical protein